MVIAQAFRQTAEGTFDIGGIFDRVDVEGPPYKVPMAVIAKVRFDPSQAGQTATITVRLVQVGGGKSAMMELPPYLYPTLQEWIQGVRPVVTLRMAPSFAEPGEYAIEFHSEGKLIANESFIVAKA